MSVAAGGAGGTMAAFGCRSATRSPNIQYWRTSRSIWLAGQSSPAPRARPMTHVQPGKSKKSALIATWTPTSARSPHCRGVAFRSAYLVARTETPGAQRSATTRAAAPDRKRRIPGYGVVNCAAAGSEDSTTKVKRARADISRPSRDRAVKVDRPLRSARGRFDVVRRPDHAVSHAHRARMLLPAAQRPTASSNPARSLSATTARGRHKVRTSSRADHPWWEDVRCDCRSWRWGWQ